MKAKGDEPLNIMIMKTRFMIMNEVERGEWR